MSEKKKRERESRNEPSAWFSHRWESTRLPPPPLFCSGAVLPPFLLLNRSLAPLRLASLLFVVVCRRFSAPARFLCRLPARIHKRKQQATTALLLSLPPLGLAGLSLSSGDVFFALYPWGSGTASCLFEAYACGFLSFVLSLGMGMRVAFGCRMCPPSTTRSRVQFLCSSSGLKRIDHSKNRYNEATRKQPSAIRLSE